MSSLSSRTVVDAPADAVWEVVAHRFDRISEWATAIAGSAPAPGSAAAPGVGAAPGPEAGGAPVAGRVCRTGLAMVPEVTETVVAYDAAGRSLTYEATAGVPSFVTLARNRWHVTALADGRAQVGFDAQLEVRGLLGRLARWWLLASVGRTGRHLLDDLKHYVEHGEPSPRKQRRSDPAASRLRAALRANATFSLVSGLALAVVGLVAGTPRLGTAAEAVTVPAAVLPSIGLGVAGFGILVARLAALPPGPLRRWAAGVVAADAGWVAGSVVLLVWRPPAAPAAVVVAVLSAVVAGLAAWQVAGIATLRAIARAAARAATAGPGRAGSAAVRPPAAR